VYADRERLAESTEREIYRVGQGVQSEGGHEDLVGHSAVVVDPVDADFLAEVIVAVAAALAASTAREGLYADAVAFSPIPDITAERGYLPAELVPRAYHRWRLPT